MIELIKQIYHNVPWHTLGLLLGAAGITSTFTQYLKKKLSLVNKKVINTVLLAFSFAPVAIQYIMTRASQNPSILGGKALVVAGFASTIVYPFIISPLDKLLTDVKAMRGLNNVASIPTVTGVPPQASTAINVIESSQEFQA